MKTESYQRMSKNLDFKPDGWRLATHLGVDALLAALIGGVAATRWNIVGQLLVPIFMFRMFALMHDCLHQAASKNRLLSSAVGILAGACCLLPYEPWKKIHLAHHKWAGNVDKDPSMGLVKSFPHAGKGTVRFLGVCWRSWIPGLALSQHLVFWSKSYRFVIEAKARPEQIRNALSILIPAMLYTQVPWVSYWPGLVAYLVMVEVVNFPHHLQMPMIRGEASLPAREQYRTARSCIYPRFISHHVLNNFNLHIEHHLYPSLPWYRLPQAREQVLPELGEAYTEVAHNQWILENRKRPIEEILTPNYEAAERRAA